MTTTKPGRAAALEFDDTPLIEVVAFNRRNELQIEVLDEELEIMGVTGMLDTRNPEALLQLLELVFEVRVERIDGRLVRLWPGE